MRAWKRGLLPIILVLIASCDRDRSLQPLADSKKIQFLLTLPPEAEPLPLEITYRSVVCKQRRINAKGGVYEIPGFKYLVLDMTERKNSWEKEVALEGGGQCSWSLSNITVRFKYKYKYKYILNDGVMENIPSKITFTLDDNSPPVSDGTFRIVNSKTAVSDDYYPVITTYHNPMKKVFLLKVRSPYTYYKIQGVSIVRIIPRIHADNLTKVTQPATYGAGSYFKVEYSDGVIQFEKFFPDFNKLETMH